MTVGLATLRRAQLSAGRTAIDVGLRLPGKRLMADAILCFEPRGSPGLRNVGHDPVLLAGLERVAVVVAGIGESRQRLDAKRVLCGLGYVVKLAAIVAVVDDLARGDQLVLVVDGDLDVVARHHLAVLRQQAGIRIGSRQLRLAALFQSRQIGLQARALGHQGRHLLRDVSAAVVPAIPPRRRTFRFGSVVGFERGAIGFNLAIDLRQPLGQLALRLDARLAGVAIKECAVDRHHLSAQKVQFAQHQHELPVRRLERFPVLLAELGDGAIAGHQMLHQPDQFQIAAGLALQAARRPDPVEIAVKIELQQITRMVRRLPCTAARSGMTEAKLPKLKRCNKSFDHSNRIVASHIIFHTRRQQARLMPADAGLERTIRHAESYRPSPNLIRFLPSLCALPILRVCVHQLI